MGESCKLNFKPQSNVPQTRYYLHRHATAERLLGSHMAPNCYATISVAVRTYVHYITYRDGQYKLRSTSARIFHVRDMVSLDNIGIDEQ